MLDRFFRLSENHTTVRTELLAGLTTFLTMAYIIFLQPAVLSGSLSGEPTGLDFGAVTTATCLAAALATLMMAVYARYPIAQAPGMGENFFFLTTIALITAQVDDGMLELGATEPWQLALGIVFVAGLLFVLLSLLGFQSKLMEAISPSMRHAIAVGIGLFIAFIGVSNAGLIVTDGGIRLNPQFASPDLIVFFVGLLATAGLHARRVRGSIIWGILIATVLAVGLKSAMPMMPDAIAESELVTQSKLTTHFVIAERVVSEPPSMAPTFLKMDLTKTLSLSMLKFTVPFILIFLFMDVFDTLGTLIGVSEQAGLIKEEKLPRMKQALVSSAVGTAAGAAFGTSTVTSFIESAAGVEQGGRTGLTALVVGLLFLLGLFFSPIVEMVGRYPPITAPALVLVGSMMMRNVTMIDWANHAESLPAFLTIAAIPLSYSIGDGLALGFIAYPVIKLLAGQGRDVKWLMYVMAAVLVAYFVLVRAPAG
jgi:AGZA family xanthine/uracil permease-like MFS transporter